MLMSHTHRMYVSYVSYLFLTCIVYITRVDAQHALFCCLVCIAFSDDVHNIIVVNPPSAPLPRCLASPHPRLTQALSHVLHSCATCTA